MARMIELIRQAAVPANLMRAAARGALSLPLPEMVEVLVQLTTMPLFADQAQLTLAGWGESLLAPVLGSAETSPEVLEYFLAPANLRAPLLPALLGNPAIDEARLARLAAGLPERHLRLVLGIVLAHERARSMPGLVEALADRAELTKGEVEALRAEQHKVGEKALLPDVAPAGAAETAANDPISATATAAPVSAAATAAPAGEPGSEPGDDEAEFEKAYWSEHAAEIQAAEGTAFQLIGPTRDEQAELAAARSGDLTGLAAHALAIEPRQRVSTIQKISRMTVGERVQLALKGSREERLILIRDGVKVVSIAVLQSPRSSEQDVEMYASMRNVGEHVLRGIAGSRRFMRRYVMKRLLTANPRCPIDVALSLVMELLVSDLDNLSKNKNVSDTVCKFAFRMLRSKRDRKD